MPGSEISTSSSRNRRYIGRLSLTKSDGSVRYFNIKRSILIGRGKECDIRIKVKTVSRIHCKVNLERDGEFVLENVSTTNFTVLNKGEVAKSAKLKNGDVITVAERDFLFQLIDTDAAGAAAGAAGGAAGPASDASLPKTNGGGLYSILCGAPVGQEVIEANSGEEKGGGCSIM